MLIEAAKNEDKSSIAFTENLVIERVKAQFTAFDLSATIEGPSDGKYSTLEFFFHYCEKAIRGESVPQGR
jgi:hypothetical protein